MCKGTSRDVQGRLFAQGVDREQLKLLYLAKINPFQEWTVLKNIISLSTVKRTWRKYKLIGSGSQFF